MKLGDFSQSANTRPPSRLGQRYDQQSFLPDPGNTVVCHLDLDTAGGAAVLWARQRMQALPEADRLLFTPEESLHMTVFEGVLDARRTADAWPKDMARDASVGAVTEQMMDRLATFDAPAPFAITVDQVRLGGLELSGATPADKAALLEWREVLSRVFGYRQTAHDTYRHHMTFAYMLDWLPDAVLPDWKQGLADIQAELQAAAPILPLRPPAFCTFNDMTWFEELRPLA